jgi:aryl-alcohol dehydrogenase-like predicted oxidoreductase
VQKSPDDFEEGDFRRSVPRYSKENFPNILKLADGLKQVGAAHGATAGQVALAWVLAQGADVIPIPGTRKIKVRALVVRDREERALIVLQYLHENVRSLDVRLSSEELDKVRTLVQEADVQGDRYPPGFMETLYADTPAWK